MTLSGEFVYLTWNNLKHFGDVSFNPLDPGSFFNFEIVLASNIMEKRKRIFIEFSGHVRRQFYAQPNCLTAPN